jgi:hypothetical protein
MNTDTARKILELPKGYNEKQLRKAYLSLSLKYHPDKNASDGSMFRKLNEAYVVLDEQTGSSLNPNISDMNPSDLWKEYLYYVFDVDNDTFRLIQNMLQKTNEITKNIIHKCDHNILLKINSILSKYGSIFSQSVPEHFDINEYTDREIITVSPTLEQLLRNDIFCLTHKDSIYYVPSWHRELEFNTFVVQIIPSLPENIHIDDENNVHIFITRHIRDIMDKKDIQIVLGLNVLNIECTKLSFQKTQTIVLRHCGIGNISYEKQDMFEIQKTMDVIIRLTIVYS